MAIVRDISNPNLPSIIETHWFRQFEMWASTPYGEVHEEPGLKRVNLFSERIQFNSVSMANLKEDDVEDKIDEMSGYFDGYGLSWSWYVGPTTQPSNMGEYLQKKGLRHAYDMIGMAVNLDSLNESVSTPEGLVIKRVEDDDMLRDWLDAATIGFSVRESVREQIFDMESSIGFGGDAPRDSYVGYLDGEPVSNSLVLYSDGVAGIYCVSTVPKARRKGIGAAISLRPLVDARDRGYKISVLHSSQMGYGVYSGLGFEELCKISAYQWIRQ